MRFVWGYDSDRVTYAFLKLVLHASAESFAAEPEENSRTAIGLNTPYSNTNAALGTLAY